MDPKNKNITHAIKNKNITHDIESWTWICAIFEISE